MKIIFRWDPFFQVANSQNNEFAVLMDPYSQFQYELFNSTWFGKWINDHRSANVHDLFSKLSFIRKYKFEKSDSLISAAIDCMKIFSENLEATDLDKYANDSTIQVLFTVHGNSYIEDVHTQVNHEIRLKDIGDKGMIYEAPTILKFLDDLNKTSKNKYEIDMSHLLLGRISISGKKIFPFIDWISYLSEINKSLINKITEIKSLGFYDAKNNPKHYFDFKYIHDWLLKLQSNLLNFFTITESLIEHLEQHKTNSDPDIMRIQSLSNYFSSSLYEFLKIYSSKEKTESFTTILNCLQADRLTSKLLSDIKILEIVKTKDGNKVFADTFMKKWINELKNVRESNFHLALNDHNDNPDNNYLMNYIEDHKKDHSLINKTIDFVYEAQDLIYNLYLLIWQIYNYLTGSVLTPVENIKLHLDKYIKKRNDF